MIARLVRRLAVAAALAAAAAMLGVAALHLPWARARALAWTQAALADRFDLVLSARGLSYNLVSRHAVLDEVSLAARGHEAEPFFSAARVEAWWPWSVYLRAVAIERLDVDRAAVTIARDARGRSNLPEGAGTPPPTPRRLDLRELHLRGLSVRYADRLRDIDVRVPDIRADLARGDDGLTGPLAVAGPTTLRAGARTLEIAPAGSAVVFDGTNVRLAGLRVTAAEGDLTLGGGLQRILDAPRFDLTLGGSVDLETAARWAPPPVPVGGSARVAGSLIGPIENPTAEIDVVGRGITIGRERDVAIDGAVRVTRDEASSDGLDAKPSTGGGIHLSFVVPFDAAAARAAAAWRGVDAVTAFHLADLEALPLGATLDGSLAFDGAARPSLRVRNRATAMTRRRRAAVAGTLSAALDEGRLVVSQTHRLDGLDVEGPVIVAVGSTTAASSLGGQLRVRVHDAATALRSLAPLGATAPDAVADATGASDIAIELAGSVAAPVYRAFARSAALEVPNLGRVAGTLRAEVTPGRVAISDIDLRSGSARVDGAVTADLRTRALGGALRLDAARGEDLQQAVPEAWRIVGPVRATGVLGGTIDRARLDATLHGSALTWWGQPIDEVEASASLTADDVEVTRLLAAQGAGRLSASGRYRWDSETFALSIDGKDVTWTTGIASEGDTTARGDIDFRGQGTLSRPEGRGRVAFALTNATAGSLLGRGDLTVDLAGAQARLQGRMPSLGALVDAVVDTSAPFAWRGVAVLAGLDVAPLASLAGARAGEVRGALSLTATASGTLQADRPASAFANLQAFEASVGGVPVRLAAPVRLAWQDETLSVEEALVEAGSGRLQVAGTWTERDAGQIAGAFTGPLGDVMRMARAFGAPSAVEATGTLGVEFRASGSAPLAIQARVRDGTLGAAAHPPPLTGLHLDAALDGARLTVARLSGHLSTANASGDFSASAAAVVPSLDRSAIEGSLTLDAASFVAASVPVAPVRPSRLTLSGGRLTLDDVTWSVAGMPVAMSGVVHVDSDDPVLDLSVRGTADLRVLSAFVPSVGFDGSADVDARIQGASSAPRLGGRVVLAGAEMALAEPRLVLADLSGVIVLDGRRIRIERVTGTANGGAATLDGALEIDGREIAGGELAAQASGMALEFPDGLRTDADVLITWRPDLRAPTLSGDVRVLRGSFTDTITLAGIARPSRQVSHRIADPTYLDRLRLNVTVDTADDIVVDNNYGRFAAGAELTVVGTGAAPGMTGRVTLREGGVVFLAGRTFQLTRGDVSFANLQRIDPEFNLAAEARVGSDDVRMTVSGTLDNLAVDLASATGSSTPAELAAAIVGGGRAGEGALAVLSADVLGLTGRAIGLDTLRLERGDLADTTFRDDPTLIADQADPAARLTLAKRLSRQVEVTLSQNLRESGKTTVIVSYRPIGAFDLRALSRDNASLGIGVRHELTFGGDGTRARARGAGAAVKVSAIVVHASSPALEAELARRLALTRGRRFDFVAWQQDIGRLRAWMRSRGHFEARVRARQIDEGEGGVALEYRVESGPATRLDVSGVELPPAERAAIEEAWSRSVFDPFLADEVRGRIGRHLVGLNVVGATVEVVVDRPSPDTKRAKVVVTGGTRVSSREIRFEGQRALEAATLLAVVEAAGVEVEGWLRPAAVVDAVEAVYRGAGYLAARVTAGGVRVEGAVAVLPVTIAEGPRAQVRGLEWRGVDPARRTAIESAGIVTVPAPYTADVVSEARRRISARYRADGFGAVEVEIAARVDETGANVTLAIDVAEGPRQVLAEVVTKGARRTAPAVVTGALRLPIGEPVDLDEWARARKRVYDTNVFQQVDVSPVAAGPVKDGVQPMRAEVSVREYPAWRLRYGLQLEGDRVETLGELTEHRNLGVVADLRTENLFGRALTLGAFGQYEYDARHATLLLSSARLFGWRARTTAFGFAERDRLRGDAGDVLAIADRSGASVEQRWRRQRFELAYGYRIERNHTYDPAPSPIDPFPLDFSARIARASVAALVDRRDDPLNSRRGTFSSASWEQAASWLGSDLRNAKVLAQQYVFVPAGPLVLASRVQVGGAYGPDGLLPDDRFRAGGATTVRGYGEDSLGPRDVFGLPAGGELLFVLNVEARVPLYRWLGAVGFVDAGSVFAGREAVRWGEVKAGYGAGLRVDSPLGLLRLDFGVPASALQSARPRPPNSLKSGRWYIGIGQVF